MPASEAIKLDARQTSTLEREFMQVFAMKTKQHREEMVRDCMRARKLTRDRAMRFLIDDLRRDIRSWR
jgi:hypothetical protein